MQKINARKGLRVDGWASDFCVEIDQGRIWRIHDQMQPGIPTVDLLLPAPVNLHSHAFQRAMAGLTETRGPDPRDSFWTWRTLMYRFLDRLTPDHVQAIAELVFMEMLEAGFGAVAEFHYLHHNIAGVPYANLSEMADRIATAAQNTGLGLTLLPVLYMQGGCDGRALVGGQQRFGCDLDGFAKLFDATARTMAQAPMDHMIGIAPHSLRAVTPDALVQLRSVCAKGPIHMHLAEQVAEVSEVQEHTGARPVEWLLDNANVGPDWCLIHCTQMTDAETTQLAATGAVAGLCPITESSLGDGVFNGVTYRAAGGAFGIGSDSNIHIALWEELATLDYSQRLRDLSRAAMATSDRSTGRVLFDAITSAGAQAAGRDAGQIAEGLFADLIAVSTDNEFLCNRAGDTLLDSLIFTGRGRSCVTDVWSAGRHVVQDGRHIDRDRIARKFVDVANDLGQQI
ncbi:MAG: formimidoylglutamate deiminase [Pseudomonadota bacterium]